MRDRVNERQQKQRHNQADKQEPVRPELPLQVGDQVLLQQQRQNKFMASNAMSRIGNQDGTCLVQILLSHTFLP